MCVARGTLAYVSSHRDWHAWLGLIAVLVLIAVVAVLVVTREGGELVELRGLDEQTVLERFGPPDRDVELAESDGGPEFRAPAILRMRAKPLVRVRELVWEGQFRTRYVWVDQREGEWVVFQAYEHGPGLKH
jgi:uncharacterized iron-regulated membrane protein